MSKTYYNSKYLKSSNRRSYESSDGSYNRSSLRSSNGSIREGSLRSSNGSIGEGSLRSSNGSIREGSLRRSLRRSDGSIKEGSLRSSLRRSDDSIKKGSLRSSLRSSLRRSDGSLNESLKYKNREKSYEYLFNINKIRQILREELNNKYDENKYRCNDKYRIVIETIFNKSRFSSLERFLRSNEFSSLKTLNDIRSFLYRRGNTYNYEFFIKIKDKNGNYIYYNIFCLELFTEDFLRNVILVDDNDNEIRFNDLSSKAIFYLDKRD
jgi:hypothetical protein